MKIKKKNVIILDLKRYHELFDLEKEIKEGKRLVVVEYIGDGGSFNRTFYYTDDEVAKDLASRCHQLEEKNKKLMEASNEVTLSKLERQPTIKDIKQLTCWQFKRWKSGKIIWG